jgi:dTDP-4-amino-4,6-dideoxygalactose transaminase
MKVPLLDLKAQYATIKNDVDAAIAGVIESQYFIMGPEVSGLEEEVAEYSNVDHAIGCASGSDALLLALVAVGVKAGDEVICPTYTFFATAGAVERIGAVPVFVDIDPVTYNLDPASTRQAARQCRRLKAIIPVHLYGQCADMTEMEAIASEFDVPLIEDAAQAIGSEDARGRRAGSMGSVGCFSFFPSKNLGGFGDGGMTTTGDAELAERMKILRLHGSKPKYYHKVSGFNSRLDALQAAVLRVKLKHLDAWTAGRQKNAARYDEAFTAAGAKTSNVPLGEGGFGLRTPEPAPSGARHIYNQYVIRVPAQKRDALKIHLKEKDVGTEIYYPVPLHRQQCFAPLGYEPGSLPMAEAAARESLALPIYPELEAEQIQFVADTIVRFLKSGG